MKPVRDRRLSRESADANLVAQGISTATEQARNCQHSSRFTAHTMIAAVSHLREAAPRRPVCVAVHALFADDAYAALQAAGPERIVTCNTVAHPTNEIDVNHLIATNVSDMIGRPLISTLP